MNFLSDTTAPAHPAILKAMTDANDGFAPSYGADPVSARVKARLIDLFETELEVLFTTSGTAANALALSILSGPDEIILCHDEAHIHRDERGAPEFFTGGAKLLPIKGENAKIAPEALDAVLKPNGPRISSTPRRRACCPCPSSTNPVAPIRWTSWTL
jgi:threonine aldolase